MGRLPAGVHVKRPLRCAGSYKGGIVESSLNITAIARNRDTSPAQRTSQPWSFWLDRNEIAKTQAGAGKTVSRIIIISVGKRIPGKVVGGRHAFSHLDGIP